MVLSSAMKIPSGGLARKLAHQSRPLPASFPASLLESHTAAEKLTSWAFFCPQRIQNLKIQTQEILIRDNVVHCKRVEAAGKAKQVLVKGWQAPEGELLSKD